MSKLSLAQQFGDGLSSYQTMMLIDHYKTQIEEVKSQIEDLKKARDKYIIHKNQYVSDITQALRFKELFVHKISHVRRMKNQIKTILADGAINHLKNTMCEYPSSSWDINSFQSYFSKDNIRLEHTFNPGPNIRYAKFAPSGAIFVLAVSKRLYIIETISGVVKQDIETSHACSLTCRNIEFFPDSNGCAIALAPSLIGIYDWTSKNVETILTGHNTSVTALSITRDGQTLISGSQDGIILTWCLATKTLQQAVHLDRFPIANIFYSGDYIFVGQYSGIILKYNKIMTKLLAQYDIGDKVLYLGQSAQNEIISFYEDATLKIWTIDNTESACRVQITDTKRISCCCTSPRYPILFFGSHGEQLHAYDTNIGYALYSLQLYHNCIISIDHHPSENAYITCSSDGTVHVWRYSVPPYISFSQ